MKTTLRFGLLAILATLSWAGYAQSAAPSPGPPAVERQNEMLSQIYVEQGASALANQHWTTVASLMRVALEFNPQNSDALYIRGEMYEKMGGKIPEAIASYQEALSADRWTRFSPSACTLKLVPLLIRTKQYHRALDALQGLGNISSDVLYYNAESLAGLGRNYQANNLLAQAIAAYPSETRFARLRIRISSTYRQSLASQILLGQLPPSLAGGTLISLISHVSSSAQKRQLVAFYDRHFPLSTLVFAQSLLASTAVTVADINTYVSDGFLTHGRLTEELYAHLPAGGAKSALATRVASFTGSVGLDTNGDGFDEETADYVGGKLTKLVVDDDQDGVPEYVVSFLGGVPSDVSAVENGTTYQLTYGNYPFIAAATVDANGDKTVYTLQPGSVSFPLFGGRTAVPGGPGAFPPVLGAPPSLGRQELFAFATQVQTTNKVTNEPVQLWKKSIDGILQMEKQWQSGRYNYRAFFHNGVKFSAEIDIDHDGYYEVHEYYRNGKVWKITYDGDHDGIPGFTLVLQPYPILSWDFNDDGVADEIEKQVSPTTTILEFSTKMNGVFNVVTKEVKK